VPLEWASVSQAGIGELVVAAAASWIRLACSSRMRALVEFSSSTDLSDIPDCVNDMACVVSLDWLGLSFDVLVSVSRWETRSLSPPDCTLLRFTAEHVSWCSMKLSTLLAHHQIIIS
jgi:hypothetical protein